MLKEIYQRQSIRKYKTKPVEQEKIEELLKAAMQAPTARNNQTWRFLVITNRRQLDEMTELQPYTGMMKTAPCAILVMGDKEASADEGYLYLDGAAAIENILIEAVHQGLGTCWCGIWPKKERVEGFQKKFFLPTEYIPIGIVAVGYADEEKPVQDRFDAAKIRYVR